jgi:hypothetical protein
MQGELRARGSGMIGRGSILFSLACVTLQVLAASAKAENSSAYTELDLSTCEQEPPDPDDPLQSGVWWCEGLDGIDVYVAEGDLRFFVSYGEFAEDEPAAAETLPAFNTLGPRIEWRLDESGEPFATILRFHTESGEGEKGSTLVVTRLAPPGEVCRVGFVDAAANPDANALAREVADNVAPDFRCGEEEALDYGEDSQP